MLKRISILFFIISMGVLAFHNVDKGVTKTDAKVLSALGVLDHQVPAGASFFKELEAISAIQKLALDTASAHEPIPHGSQREPENLLKAGRGYCYDRSRMIEKSLRMVGMSVRHVAMYHRPKGMSKLKTLLTPGGESHSITEVRTSKGWLVVDSNSAWVSIDRSGEPVPIDIISESVAGDVDIDWVTEPPSEIYNSPFVYAYGLYSRHGKFYPPYSPIPDVNFSELLNNL